MVVCFALTTYHLKLISIIITIFYPRIIIDPAHASEVNDQYYASRPIFPLQSYRDITLFHYTIPDEIVSARWTIWSNSTSNCDSKEVTLLLRWQGYPLIPSLHNATASKDVLIDFSEQYDLHLKTNEIRTTSFTLSRPLPGQWFGIGFIKHSSNRIVQRGLHSKCKVSLSTRLSMVKLKLDEEVKLITSDSQATHRLQDRLLFKFYVPLFTNSAKLTLSGCSRITKSGDESDDDEESSGGGNGSSKRRSGEGCPIKIYTRSLGLPSDRLYDSSLDCSPNLGDDCIASGFNFTQNGWNYVLLVKKPSRTDNIPVEFSASIATSQCIHNRNIEKSNFASASSLVSRFSALLSSPESIVSPSSPSLESSSATSVPPLSAYDVLSELPDPISSSPQSTPSPPQPIDGTIDDKEKRLFSFSSKPKSHSQDNNPLWFTRHLLKSTETDFCPFRVNLVRYNLHGSFNFQYDYADAFKPRVGHFTVKPFVDIPNSMTLSVSNKRNPPLVDEDLTDETNEREKRILPSSGSKDNLTELSVLHFEILPILDSGGTLTIDVGLNPFVNMTKQNVSIYGCLQHGHYSTAFGSCQYSIKVNSSHNPLIALKLPYPRAGLWFISLKTECYHFDGRSFKTEICQSNSTSILMSIKSNSCFENQCGPHGKCNQFISGGLIFSTCICNSGWKGMDCTDGTDALDEREILINFLLLTLSNLVFVPALILALYRHLFTEAFIYLIAMSSSILYHACDSDSLQAFCLIKLNVLQYVDFYSALLAFWVTLISLSNLPTEARSFFHLVGSVLLAIGVQYDRTSLWTFVVPVSAGFVIVILTWCFFCCIKRNCFPSCQLWSLSMLPGLVMTSAGLAIYSLFETKDNYAIVHSFWHAVMASALVFLIPTMEHKSKKQASPPDEEDENFRGKGINHETYYELIAEEGSHLARHPLT